MQSASERRTGCIAVAGEGVEVRGRDGRGDGYADGAAEVLGGVDQARGGSCVAFGNTGESADGDGDEGEGGPDAGDEERAGQVGPEASAGWGLAGPEHPGADEGHAEGHDRLGGGLRDELLRETGEGQGGDRRSHPGRPGGNGG